MIAFLSPLFLAGALAAAVPIVLHLLKREPEVRLKFSAVKLLHRAPVEHSQRRHLRELLLLALRVAALVLLALTFARPFLAPEAASAASGLTVVALDTSLSLSAPGQFERAQQLAKDAVGRSGGDQVGVITFADAARPALQPTSDRALAVSAIEAAAPGFGATHYRAALMAAADMASAHGSGRTTIVVVTDLQESGWDAGDRAAVPESARIEIADVGVPPANLAVTAVQVTSARTVATIRNAGAQAREARLQLTVDGRVAGEAGAVIGPNQSADVTLAGAQGTRAEVSVADRDGVQADNVRYAVLDTAGRTALLVVTASGEVAREAFYVQHALTATRSNGAAYAVEGVGAGRLSTWDRARMARYTAVLLLSTRGLERRGRELLTEYIQKGGGLLLAAGPDVDGDVAADVLGGSMSLASPAASAESEPVKATRTLVPADTRHPVFLAFAGSAATLGLPRFQNVATIQAPECETLARFTTAEAALVDCALGQGRALVLASDLDNEWNDLPLHATFVPFLHETVRYLAGRRHQAGGQCLVAQAPPGVPAKPGIATWPPSAGGGELRLIAINVDPAESDPARLSADEFQAAVTRLKDVDRTARRVDIREREERQHLWQYVLTLLIALLAVESLVAARTA